jgi:hypothetical protein
LRRGRLVRRFNRRQALENQAFVAEWDAALTVTHARLPALEQVTGWSQARAGPEDAASAAKPALFGGWRLKDREGR